MHIAGRRLELLVLTVALALPIAVFAIVYAYALDVPYLDDWEWTPMIAAFRHGQIPWHDLWELHNGHRTVVADLLALGLALDGEWNVRREAIFDVGLALLTQTVWYFVVLRVVPPARRAPAFLAIVLLLFSLAQAENWIWGFQITWFVADLAIAVSVYGLARRGEARWNAVALGAALAAAHSIAYGIDLLLAGCAVALLARRRAPFEITAWLVATAVVVLWYAHDFTPGVYQPPATTGLARAVATLAYALMVLGGPVALSGGIWAALGAGMLGCALYGYAAYTYARARRSGGEHAELLLVPLALGLISLLTALQIGYSRLFQGYPTALASRYVTVSSFLWIGLVLAYAAGALPVPARLRRWRRLPAVSAALALALWAGAQAGGYALLRERTLYVFAGAQVIPRYASAPEDEIRVIWPGERFAADLDRLHDGPFATR